MKTENRRPAWWQLYLLGIVMIGLLVLGAWAPLSELGHQLAAIGALVLVYGLIALWLHVNGPALLHAGKLLLQQQPGQKVVGVTICEGQVPIYISWRPPLETEMAAGDNEDHAREPNPTSVALPDTGIPRLEWQWDC